MFVERIKRIATAALLAAVIAIVAPSQSVALTIFFCKNSDQTVFSVAASLSSGCPSGAVKIDEAEYDRLLEQEQTAGAQTPMPQTETRSVDRETASPVTAETDVPLSSMVIGMAQHFVQEKYMFGPLGHYHIEFDVAYLHPQPQPDYWAVVGGFVSDQNTPNTFVAAVRLICPDFAEVECWRLEKLAINGKIILDLGKPL